MQINPDQSNQMCKCRCSLCDGESLCFVSAARTSSVVAARVSVWCDAVIGEVVLDQAMLASPCRGPSQDAAAAQLVAAKRGSCARTSVRARSVPEATFELPHSSHTSPSIPIVPVAFIMVSWKLSSLLLLSLRALNAFAAIDVSFRTLGPA